MWFGYITINGTLVQIFLNKNDAEILESVRALNVALDDFSVSISWNNQQISATTDDILKFLEDFKIK